MACVLLIDDDIAFQKLMLRVLSSEHEVVLASSGAQGLDYAVALKPELILLDLRMPILDGVETLNLIRASESIAQTPVVLMTACVGLDGVGEANRLGLAGVLAKCDMSPAEIRDLVRAAAAPAGNRDTVLATPA